MVAGIAAAGETPAAPQSAEPPATHDRPMAALWAGVAMLLAGVATWKGPGLSPDSVGYLSTGINVAGSHGLRMLADQPLSIFPPGLPLIAGAGEAVGLGAETTLRIVSVVSFGAIVVLGSRLIGRVVTHRGVATGATALLALSPVLLGVSKMAWSEPPFIAVTLLFLLALGRVCERRVLTNIDVVTLSALGGIAFLLRYIGVSLVVVGGIALLVALRPLNRSSLGRIVGFGVLSAVVPIACMLRNHAADGTYLGNRLASHDSLRDVVIRTAATIGTWVLPTAGVATSQLALIGAAVSVLALGGLAVTLRTADRGRVPAKAHLWCCGLFVVVYLAYLTVATLSTSFEPTNSRYLSPAYVPGVVVAAVGVASLLQRSTRPLWRSSISALLVVFLAGQVFTSVRDARDGARDGIGYNASSWVDSDVAALASDLVDATAAPIVYSNNPNALWAATDMQPIRFAPRDIAFRGVKSVGELEEFVQQVACAPGPSYLVFYLYGDTRVISLEEIKAAVDAERVAVADDGAIFLVTAAEPGVACAAEGLRPTRR